MSLLSHDEMVKQVVRYDPITGFFTRIVSAGSQKAGSRVGYADKDGYLQAEVGGINFQKHRGVHEEDRFPDGRAGFAAGLAGVTTSNARSNVFPDSMREQNQMPPEIPQQQDQSAPDQHLESQSAGIALLSDWPSVEVVQARLARIVRESKEPHQGSFRARIHGFLAAIRRVLVQSQ